MSAREYFETDLPQKFADKPDLASAVDAVFQFDVEGAGVWTVDMTGEGTVVEGPAEDPGCVIGCSDAIWSEIVAEPMMATSHFMTGGLTASDLGLAMKLQNLLA